MVIDIAQVLRDKKQKELQVSMQKVEDFLKNINKVIRADLYTKSLPRLIFDLEYIESSKLASYKIVNEGQKACIVLENGENHLETKQGAGSISIPKITNIYKTSWELAAQEAEIRKQLHNLVTEIIGQEDACFLNLLELYFSAGGWEAGESKILTPELISKIDRFFSFKHYQLGCLVLSKNTFEKMSTGIFTDDEKSVSVLGNSKIQITNKGGLERVIYPIITNKVPDSVVYGFDPSGARHNLVMPIYEKFYLSYLPEKEDRFTVQGSSSFGMGIIDMPPVHKICLDIE